MSWLQFSPRTIRLMELWLIGFLKFIGIMTIAFLIGGFIGWLIVKLVFMYGALIVLSSILILWFILVGGAIAGVLAKERLLELEYREARIMDRLRMDKE